MHTLPRGIRLLALLLNRGSKGLLPYSAVYISIFSKKVYLAPYVRSRVS
jgi:hypothetical protein